MKQDIISITISDLQESKSFYVHTSFIRFITFILVLVVSLIIGSIVSLAYLKDELVSLRTSNDFLQREQKTLEKKNLNLKADIAEKNSQLSGLEELEKLIEIEPSPEDNIKSRINTAKLSFFNKQFLLENIPSGWPIPDDKPRKISSSFGFRIHPIERRKKFHAGLDMSAKIGTKIIATAHGVVNFSGRTPGFGRVIRVSHNFGFTTYYGHLKKSFVKSGDFVTKGQVIAESGNTGRSTGPHLHYEVRYLNKPLDPKDFVDWNLGNYNSIFEVKRPKWNSLIKTLESFKYLKFQQ